MTSISSLRSGIDALDLKNGNADVLNSPSGSSAPSIPQFTFNFDRLKRQMDIFQAKFDEFVANDRKKILEDRNAFEQEIQEGKEKETEMLNQIRWYKEKEEEISEEMAREQQEVLETEQSISEFTRKKQELAVLRDAVVKQISEVQQMLEKAREERSKERSKILAQSSLNAPELAFWEQNLGMRIEGVDDDYLKIIFTLISEANWDKEYYVVVDLTSVDYEVSKCEPSLNKSVLERIVNRLNETRDFARFLKEVRNAFKESGL
ncbi:chromosome segregation protein Spc25-domain-containing protein [Myxozyma melibiosi]|uniref:Kinetochore protein SPC25 n=1 Tax=Myxozyma melibiosi TaxID=54550 RepID=A0ABR1FDA8_9ASCO